MAAAEADPEPYPVVMNAGGSEKGRHFATKFCDVAFVAVQSHDPDSIRAQVNKYRTLAREHGRDIQVWTNAYIVQGETEADARKFFDHYVHERATGSRPTTSSPCSDQLADPAAGVEQQLKAHFIAGWGGFPLVGTKEQVVDVSAFSPRSASTA